MIQDEITGAADGRTPVRDRAVLDAIRAVPRQAFVPKALREHANIDAPLPIGYGQTISQPYIVAVMTELLELDSDMKVLEIGTGSGYQAAVLAQLTPHVYTIEIIEPLARRAATVLREQGCTTVSTRCGDGYLGWPEEAPFDAIIVTAAPGRIPPPLWEQLAVGGRMVIPVGQRLGAQRLLVLEKTPGGRRTRTVMPVRFVPFTRD